MKVYSLLFTLFTTISSQIIRPQFAAYWQINPQPFPLNMMPQWVDIAIVAFSTIDVNSNLNFPQNDLILKDDIQYLQSRGQKVLISIGGAANCGPGGISQDNMFGMQNFNSNIWVNSTVSLVNFYNFDGVDIDYECRDGILQNPVNVAISLKELRNVLPNIIISWVAFSEVANPLGWENYKDAFLNIIQYVDKFFWASYNINLNPSVADKWYASANITQLSQLGANMTNDFYGYCLGNGCAYGPGPYEPQILQWATSVKNYGGGGLFLWDIAGELSTLNNDFAVFNTTGISKRVADILHS